jgi:AmiR/NasT family two-component response regulator
VRRRPPGAVTVQRYPVDHDRTSRACRVLGSTPTDRVRTMSHTPTPEHLRVLIANQRPQRLDHVTTIVVSLGHEVIARSIEVHDVSDLTTREHPDVALVGLGESSQHALDLIDEIVRKASCPVIAILETDDRKFINEAAKRGIFAYIADGDAEQLQSSLDIVLRRFAEFQDLEGAFARRALIERAKGILMERHDVNEREAFELLRTHSRNSNRKLADIANSVVDGRRLLPGPPKPVT